MDSKSISHGIRQINVNFPLRGTDAKTAEIASPKEISTLPAVTDSIDINLKGNITKTRAEEQKTTVENKVHTAPTPAKQQSTDNESMKVNTSPGSQAIFMGSQSNNPTAIALLDNGTEHIDPMENAAMAVLISHFEKDHPQLLKVLEAYVKDKEHNMNVVAYLKDPKKQKFVVSELKHMASQKAPTEDELKNIVDSNYNPSNPLLADNLDEMNIKDGKKKTEILKDSLLEKDTTLFSTGDKPSEEQMEAVTKYQRKMQRETLPDLNRHLKEILSGIPKEQGFPFLSSRVKSADGIIDKIRRMREGNDGKPPRPDYCLADMPDAVGGRITVKSPDELQTVMQKLEEKFGKENIHEKDSFYSNPKKKYKPYRVLTYTVTVDGVPCEVQLTTLKASLAADLWHNTGYKQIHQNLPSGTLDVLSGMQRAVAAEEHSQIHYGMSETGI